MDPLFSGPNDQYDDVFFDALPHCPFHHCSGDADNSPESSASAFILCDPIPPSPSPATTIRHRSTRRRSPVWESTYTCSDGNSINGAGTNFQSNQNLESSKENENFLEKCESNQEKVRPFPSPSFVTEERNEETTLTTASNLFNGAGTNLQSNQNIEKSKENENFLEKCESNQEKVRPFLSPSVVTEETNEESMLTTAENDDEPGNSADSVAELVASPSNSLEYVVGLMIRAIAFQIKVFFVLMKCPLMFPLHACMFLADPFGTMKKGKGFLVEILGKAWYCVCGCMGPSIQGWFKEHNSFWNVAFRCAWGFLWSIYVCCILCSLLVSSFVVSGFLVKCLVEKPLQMRHVLNFDYTKQSPVAFVPIISCAGVGAGQDYENNVAVSGYMSKRAIPANQKVQVTVSLLVPESGYNTNLGIFQIRVDFMSSDGKTIMSSSQPCMLKFVSVPIRLVMTILKIVPLVTGYISETQTLNVKMRGFVEGDVPTSCLRVVLEQRAEYPPGAGIPQIYDSYVVIESQLPLFKRIIWHWKMSIYVWITMTAFMVQFLFLLICCWPIIIPRTRQRSGSARSAGSHNILQAPS